MPNGGPNACGWLGGWRASQLRGQSKWRMASAGAQLPGLGPACGGRGPGLGRIDARARRRGHLDHHPQGRPSEFDTAGGGGMAEHVDAEDPTGILAIAPLDMVSLSLARFGAVVLEASYGVWTRPVHRPSGRGLTVEVLQSGWSGPVPPIPVPKQDCDGGSDRPAVAAHAGGDVEVVALGSLPAATGPTREVTMQLFGGSLLTSRVATLAGSCFP